MTTWTEDEYGFMANGGDVGGDAQVSAAPARRFTTANHDGTFGVFDIYAYVVDRFVDEDGNGALDVETQVQTMICTNLEDVGGTEVATHEIEYEYPFDFAPATIEVGLDWATHYIKDFDPANIGWDGVTI